IATVSTVSALPMTVKVLHDLDLLKSDLGLLTVSALTINDIIGWAIFTVILGFASGGEPGWGHVGVTVAGTVLFATFCMTVGRRIVSRGITAIRDSRHGDAGLVLTFVCCVGLLAGAATQKLGIHALFGFFLAGIMAGGSAALTERTRHVINQMVHAVFVPVFFATIGLRIDFISGFDLLPVALLTIVGIGGRYLGAWVGARMTALSPEDRVTVAIAHTPGGSMEMVIGLIAWQFGLITLPIFVAIVFAAIVSSLLLGPWIAWSVRRRRHVDVIELFDPRAVCVNLEADTRGDMLARLAEAAANLDGMPEAESIYAVAQAREDTAGTGIGHEVAVPHARMEGLRRPLVVFGRSDGGIEWNAPDGLPVHLVFLILTPSTAADLQVQILAALARAMADEETRQQLIHARDKEQAWALLRKALGDRAVAAQPA
ncbi:MAG: PTS sugar transporter subunit IIA, partial [Planctomycetes bacterium]|nr:PTS sugar transporter subunit IIA [Planctomycetota bacterium]